MSIFGHQISRGGSWSLRSMADPRWDCDGETETNAFYGQPEEVTTKIADLTKLLGQPPDDLTLYFMKD